MVGQVTEAHATAIDVDGGRLAFTNWGPQHSAIAVVAIHGITASSRCWPLLAEALPDVRIIAPDLRGRARSNALPAPFGLPQHAADLTRALDAFGVERAVVVGHSMGGFVGVELAAHDPRVAELILVDGGLPLALPPGLPIDEAPAKLLGPAFDRLSMSFPSRQDYRDFWRGHPAFAADWSTTVEEYLDYDLDATSDGFSPSANPEAVVADFVGQFGPDWYRADLASLSIPVSILRAPRGLMNEAPGLYAPARMETFQTVLPQLRVIEVTDVNHYTILMAPRGAGIVGVEVQRALRRMTA